LTWLAALVVLVTCSACALGGDDDQASLDADFVTELVRLGSDRSEGTVGLRAEPGGKTRVEILLLEPATGQRVEIGGGTCELRQGGAVYVMPQLDEGRSQRVVDVPVRELRRAGYHVLVHDAAGIGGVCGDFASSRPPDAAPTFE
jgi:hypothetical protein